MRYEVVTELTPREALEQAITDFGSGGLGLAIISQSNLSLVFQGGGGYIGITARPGATTTIELETREWDYAVQQFMARVHRRRSWWQRLWRRKRSRPSQPPSFTILPE
jgi:hypothetical protein